ncbi:hypothetical protein ACTI_53930 [Actinoplanes sp. OR16]|uniref:hypothetical protein n=1 Tax=Actinoplanes sp. OR16 TaxID=946334 RepID=UPI000F6CD220|nr:hypothetical protein [Actinoplanes sp. OR16]BBH68708.1 hypothetical protein ACTI_53930 [Actinoplanes sp. OR16]
MSSKNVIVRRTAITAPALMFGYGVLRFIDGLDGDRGNGLAWDAGHVAFFVAMVLFGVLAVAMRPLTPTWARRTGAVAVAAALFGIGCFLWVIAGDLSDRFREAAPLPDVLESGGSALFPLGMLVLLGLLVAARRLPVWSPLLFGAGIAAITIDLDMLPFASLIILAALAPLARPGDEDGRANRGGHHRREATTADRGEVRIHEVNREAARARFKPQLSGH